MLKASRSMKSLSNQEPMPRQIATILVFSLLAIFVIGYAGCEDRLVPPMGLELSSPLSIKFKQIKKEVSKNILTVEYRSNIDKLIFRVYKNMKAETARKKAKDRRLIIMDMFKGKPSPYPGVISDQIACDDKYQPKEHIRKHGENWSEALQLFANERGIYGGCTEKTTFFSSALVHLYCTKIQTLFVVKLFTPNKSPSVDIVSFIGALNCIEK